MFFDLIIYNSVNFNCKNFQRILNYIIYDTIFNFELYDLLKVLNGLIFRHKIKSIEYLLQTLLNTLKIKELHFEHFSDRRLDHYFFKFVCGLMNHFSSLHFNVILDDDNYYFENFSYKNMVSNLHIFKNNKTLNNLIELFIQLLDKYNRNISQKFNLTQAICDSTNLSIVYRLKLTNKIRTALFEN